MVNHDAIGEQANSASPTQSDVDDILRKKRKVREPRACYPCRHRKVRCDGTVPCSTCIDRDHADLCAFQPSSRRSDTGEASSSQQEAAPIVRLSVTRGEWDRLCRKLNSIERSVGEIKSGATGAPGPSNAVVNLESSQHLEGSSANSSVVNFGSPVNVKLEKSKNVGRTSNQASRSGTGSIPGLITAVQSGWSASDAAQSILASHVLQYFGSDESSGFSHVNPYGSPPWGQAPDSISKFSNIARILPNDSRCLELFRQYRDMVWISYPAVVDLDLFESNLFSFLSTRSLATSEAETSPLNGLLYSQTIPWISILFAALASGSQYITVEGTDRDFYAQVYACCAFECLTMANYFPTASLEVSQVLHILAHVLATAVNNVSPPALLSLNLRLHQSLSLHHSTSLMDAVQVTSPPG